MKTLEDIFSPIKKELAKVRQIIRDGVDSENDSLSKMGEYLFSSKGKLLRPALVLLSSRIAGCKDMKRAIRVAGAIELIHTATLVHDDIIDRAVYRRDKKTINNMYGDNKAILFGDYLYSAAFRLLSNIGNFNYIVNVTRDICEGETTQLALAYRYVSEKKYLNIIKKKTASLFEASCYLGAMCGDNGYKDSRALANYGSNLGMAYQIIDDCIDIIGDESNQGKSLGRDIQEGKYTLPIIYGAIDKAVEKAREFVSSACRKLDSVSDSVFKDSLLDLAGFISKRI